MKTFILKSLVAIFLAWVVACIGVVILEGKGSVMADIFGFFVVGLVFIAVAWLVFLLPFMRLIKKAVEAPKLKYGFPILSAIYAFLVFTLLFSAVTGFSEFSIFFQTPTTVTVTAAAVGCIWGLALILLPNKSDAAEAKNC